MVTSIVSAMVTSIVYCIVSAIVTLSIYYNLPDRFNLYIIWAEAPVRHVFVCTCSITELWREQEFYNIRTHVVPAARSTGVVPSCYPHFHTGSPPGFPSICYTRSPRAFQLRRFTSEHCSAMFLWIVKSKFGAQGNYVYGRVLGQRIGRPK